MSVCRKIGLLFTAVLWLLSSGAGSTLAADGWDEAVARDAAQRWAALVSQADLAGLDQLLHGDYRHIHATALVETREQFLEALRSGARKYDPLQFEDVQVRVFGDSAMVTGKFNLRVLSRGKVVEGVNRFSLLVVRTPRGPQVASYQATSVPAAK